LALPAEAAFLLISDVYAWGRPTHAASSNSLAPEAAGRGLRQAPTLRIEKLDSVKTLEALRLSGRIEQVVIVEDFGLADFRRLVVPRETMSLGIDSCRNFTGVDGLERFIGSPLRSLSLRGLRHRLPNLDSLVLPSPRHGGRRLVDQLESIVINYAEFEPAEVGDPMADLAPFGFRFSVTRPMVGVLEISAERA
jgi:hypothetical protein